MLTGYYIKNVWVNLGVCPPNMYICHLAAYLIHLLYYTLNLIYSWWLMKIIHFFLLFYQALYEIVLGVKVSVVGFPGKQDEQSLIIMNHRTRLDWLFAYSFMLRCGSLRHLKIVLKSGLKKIPGAGKLYIYIYFPIRFCHSFWLLFVSYQYFLFTFS